MLWFQVNRVSYQERRGRSRSPDRGRDREQERDRDREREYMPKLERDENEDKYRPRIAKVTDTCALCSGRAHRNGVDSCPLVVAAKRGEREGSHE